VGPATAAQAKPDPTLRTGDLFGQSGLQASSDATLRGAPSGNLTVVDPAGRAVATLARWAGRTPAPVSSTVNPMMQAAAAKALAHTGHPSALVAIDATNGAVLAAASTPAGYPRALLDRYPPGSTLKMVTLTAALMAGRTLATPTSCTPTVTVNGYTLRNAAGESFGTIPLLRAFAVSCNTSFVNLAESLPAGTMATAATLLGCNIGHAPLPVPSYGCSYPADATGTAYAASAIGQGTVLTSPLAIAAIAAAADSGIWHQTHLTPGASPVSHPLPAAVVSGLREAMRAVVTSGTGTSANLPGTPVYGKTGTAEHGTGKNPPTDAWFAAFRGNIAVAVLVEDAGFGATSAVPVATSFLAAITH
jgi:cell division protein FtsI/penicillin-binding protein 2